jgi:dTDP-4-amino-4,6-dideoxygalactose transaminase
MNVPLIDLEAQHAPIRAELVDAIARVVDSQRFILGPEVEALEAELAALLGVRHTIGVSSGTDAVLVSLMAQGIGPGDDVVTSPFSFFATAGSVVRLGARPVLADIDPGTFNLDPLAAAAAMTPRTRAILPVHLFGLSADLDPLAETAARAAAVVIEDACQAIGARYHDRPVGGIGRVGCFSFFPTKNLGALGDAGLVTTNDGDLARTLRLLRGHGAERRYYHALIGGNFRLDEMQAAVLRVKVRHLEGWTAARRRNAVRYRQLVEDAGLADRVTLPHEPAGSVHVFHQYVVRVADRDALRDHLTGRGIGTEVYYPVPFHLQACFAGLGYRPGSFPQAEAAARECLALPIHPALVEDQQAYVVQCLSDFFAHR